MLANLKIILLFFTISAVPLNCSGPTSLAKGGAGESSDDSSSNSQDPEELATILTGAEQIDRYLPKLSGKKIAMVVNQTSRVGDQHLVDALVQKGVQIKGIFAPEHGFRGKADAGEKVQDGKDAKTGVPLISLYGKKKKPGKEDLQGIDLVLFDIQDVGARFYTYISTMHYVMEACAENQLPLLILDRPNPNGHYVDGPILAGTHQSFVGMHPVPIVHGMTVGEYAQMINGEGWLAGGIQCTLEVIPCKYYDHQRFYALPLKPSPNLPNMTAIYLYPSLCLFEGTQLSVGRGTNRQFQIYGHPDLSVGSFEFRPASMEGAKYPKHEGKLCRGVDLSQASLEQLQKSGLNLE
ncbi:MAG: DUF1343 domain-containing protein, partial [Bacteroidota bacterium]